MKIIKNLSTANRCYKIGEKMTPKGLMLHSIGINQPSASVLCKNQNNSTTSVCVHAYIDGNTGDTYQTLPWNYRGWHCYYGKNGSGNNTHIGIEMCEPSSIKYTSGANFTCSNITSAKACVKKTYDAAVELFAYLCKEFKLDPMADGVIISHNEGYKRGIASNHADPEHLWKGLNTGYTMDGFRKDVKSAMGGTSTSNSSSSSSSSASSSQSSTSKISKGSLVKIASNATYYNGKSIPSWVKNQNWYVDSVSGDRAVINKNENGTNSINSPINTKFLTVVNTSYQVKVSIKTLNMRTGPSTNYPSIGYIPVGVYTIVETNGKWGRLKSQQKYGGKMVNAWIHLSYTTKL